LFRIAVLISGSGSNLQAIIDFTENETVSNFEIALVVSSREGAYGLERAKKHGIKSAVIGKDNTDKLLEALSENNIDGIVLAGYLSILPPSVINAYENRIINIHPALLPQFGGMGFYGLKVHQAVLDSGVPYTGASVHIVDCGVDTGAVLIRGVIAVLPDDTAESLQKRVLGVEHTIIVLAVKALADGDTDKLKQKPLMLISDSDRKGVRTYAKEFKELGEKLIDADSEEL